MHALTSRSGIPGPPPTSRQSDLPGALRQVDALLDRVRQAWVSQDPVQATLQDVPDPDLPEDLEWAEFRCSAQANRVHETRNFDSLHWRKAMGGRSGALGNDLQ